MLRPYQFKLQTDVYDAWNQGSRNVLMRLDTGGGKTVILSQIVTDHQGFSVVIAHRSELVAQLSLALARNGVRHSVIAATSTIRSCVAGHMAELRRSFYDPSAKTMVASVDTLIRRDDLGSLLSRASLWITDEGHHVVADNKWHTAIQGFTHPDIRGLLPTATPSRADGKGLGRHADGVADVMVQGPPMRWLIEEGYLCDYRMVLVESDMHLLQDRIGASGDWSTAALREAAKNSHIVGDITAEYTSRAPGRLGVTFTPDTETAAEVYQSYLQAGVRAALLTGKTQDGLRRQMLHQFAARQLDQLVVVDIISEGFDLPAIEVGSLGRKTASLATYMQQFGRMLRPMYADGFDLGTQEGRLASIAASPKPKALIIDHVGNFLRHGPPDRPRPWTLDRRATRSSGPSTGIPMRPCVGLAATDPGGPRVGCFQPAERFYVDCPWCGCPYPPPAGRTSPAMVDGDLSELDEAVLAGLRGAVLDVDRHHDFYREELRAKHTPAIGIMAHVKRFVERQEAQRGLRETMDLWAGQLHARGRSDREIQREFHLTFGLDVLTAQTLGPADAADLREKIRGQSQIPT